MNRHETIDELRRLADTLEALPDDTDAGCVYHTHLYLHMHGVCETEPRMTRLATVLGLTQRVPSIEDADRVILRRPLEHDGEWVDGSVSLYCGAYAHAHGTPQPAAAPAEH